MRRLGVSLLFALSSCSLFLSDDEGDDASNAVTTLPRSLAFGDVVVTLSSAPQVIQVVALEDIAALDVSVDSPVFDVLDNDCAGAALIEGQVCEVPVLFQPLDVGDMAAQLDIGRASVDLAGTGLALGDLKIDPNAFDFGGVEVGMSVPQTFEITNTGAALVSEVVVSGTTEFLATSTCDEVVLMQGESCQATVTFRPDVEGSIPGTLSVMADQDQLGTISTAASLAGSGTPDSFRLTVQVQGQGMVLVFPGGALCRELNGCSLTFPANSAVTLEASTAVTWLGDCSGSGGCDLAMDRDRSVQALFPDSE